MLDVFGQHGVQMAFAGDEHPVGALGPQRADEAFGGGVHPRGLRRGLHHCDTDGSNTALTRYRFVVLPPPPELRTWDVSPCSGGIPGKEADQSDLRAHGVESFTDGRQEPIVESVREAMVSYFAKTG
jgi:hypothetical protein